MAKVIFHYDKEGDILEVSLGKPRKAISEELENDVVVRRDPKTKEAVGLTILNFEKRSEKLKGFPVSVPKFYLF
jgi:hypothetical protein